MAPPPGLVDALSIDWSSLVSSQPGRRPASPAPGSALQRFSAGSVFRQLGVCAEWAGPEVVAMIREQCSGEWSWSYGEWGVELDRLYTGKQLSIYSFIHSFTCSLR